MDKLKAGYKTTEFWLGLATVLIGAYTAVAHGSVIERVVALGVAVLGYLGYSVPRALLKQTAIQADAAPAIAAARNPQ
jgi:hypothetical protein